LPQVGEEPVRVRVQGKVFTARRLAKLLWPEEGLTKAHLMEYLVRMAPYMLPYLRHRFLSFPQETSGRSPSSRRRRRTTRWDSGTGPCG